METCLITGASGLLGREVAAALAADYRVIPAGFSQAGPGQVRVDLRDPEALRAALEEQAPDVVVHCAAYREPDFCEQEPEETRRLNVDPVRVMCDTLPAGVPLVLVSTDYVFDGETPPYREDDPVNPLSEYGRSKVEGERIVLERESSLVMRIPLLIGAAPTLEASGFVAQMKDLVLDRKLEELDDVLIRYPTWTRDVARAIRFLLSQPERGIFHFSSLRGGTRYGWTIEMAALLGVASDHLAPSQAVVPRIAVRPANSQLEPARLHAMGYRGFTDPIDAIRDILASFS